MGSSSPPKPTPPGQTAQIQQGYNTSAGLQTQSGSMVDQFNPYGGLNYTQTGVDQYGNPAYAASTSFSAPQQALYNSLTGTQQQAGSLAQSLMGQNYGGPNSVLGNADSLTNQLTSQYLSAQQPQQINQLSWMDNSLRNQGIFPGTPAYDNAMRPLVQGQNLADLQAGAQFQPAAYQEAVSQYKLPLQTAEQLAMFGSPTGPNQSFVNAPGLNIQPANYQGAVASADSVAAQDYAAQAQQQAAMLGSIFNFGGNMIKTAGPAVAAAFM